MPHAFDPVREQSGSHLGLVRSGGSSSESAAPEAKHTKRPRKCLFASSEPLEG